MVNASLIDQLGTNKYLMKVTFCLLRSETMPQRVVCHGCSHILYEGTELKPPDEILHQYEGVCPKCGKKLSLLPIDVEVKPLR